MHPKNDPTNAVETATWADAEQQFGPEGIAVIDQAVCSALNEYSQPIPKGDHYLVSEHLTHAVLMALRESGLRFASAVHQIERFDCPVCGASTTLTKNGLVRAHRHESEGRLCALSGMPKPTAGGAA